MFSKAENALDIPLLNASVVKFQFRECKFLLQPNTPTCGLAEAPSDLRGTKRPRQRP